LFPVRIVSGCRKSSSNTIPQAGAEGIVRNLQQMMTRPFYQNQNQLPLNYLML
jgi:hypothetical protein